MNMDLNLSPTAIKASVNRFLKRFHFIIFFVFSVGGLTAGIFLLNGIVAMSDQPNGYTSSINSTSFDDATIARLRALKESGQNTEKLDLSGRINPFAE